jgi:hypothetical protein
MVFRKAMNLALFGESGGKINQNPKFQQHEADYTQHYLFDPCGDN